jgi:hypothetical protein
MASTDERVTILEYGLAQYKTETIKAYGEMAMEVIMLKGLGEDTIKRLASLRTEVGEIKVTLQEHGDLLREHSVMLRAILDKLDERK